MRGARSPTDTYDGRCTSPSSRARSAARSRLGLGRDLDRRHALGDLGAGDDRGVLGDAAGVDALLHVDVAVDPPVGVPRVAHDPVVGLLAEGVLLAAEADGLHAVVELLAARAAEDARVVRL